MHNQLTENDIKRMEEEIEYRKLVVRKEAFFPVLPQHSYYPVCAASEASDFVAAVIYCFIYFLYDNIIIITVIHLHADAIPFFMLQKAGRTQRGAGGSQRSAGPGGFERKF